MSEHGSLDFPASGAGQGRVDISHSPPSFLPLLKSSWSCSHFWFVETWTVSQQGSPGQSALRAPGAGQGSLQGADCCSEGSGLRIPGLCPRELAEAWSSQKPGVQVRYWKRRPPPGTSPLRRASASPASTLPGSLQGRGSQIPNFLRT